jgi:transposase
MRGDNVDPGAMFSYIRPAQRVPQDHPLRAIKAMMDRALQALSPELDRLYSRVGRPSIPPERLLRALLIQYLYGIRSERLLMEQLDYNLLFRWFVGLEMDDPVWDASTFSKNRERLLAGDIGGRFLEETVAQAREAGLTSDEHFSVDGTVLEAWASHKSFQKKDGSDDDRSGGGGGRNRHVDFRGKERKNDTHQSTTDPDSRMFTKGKHQGAKLSYLGHIVIENRNGLVMGAEVTFADGNHREREAAGRLLADTPRRAKATVGADKAFDTEGFVQSVRQQGVTPHVAQNTTKRQSAIDGRTTRHAGYAASQIVRKIVEHPFGWLKSAAGLWQVKVRGRDRVDLTFTFGMAVYNLVRLRNLLAVPA